MVRREEGGVLATIRSLVGRKNRWEPQVSGWGRFYSLLARSKSLLPSHASSMSLTVALRPPIDQVITGLYCY